MRAATEWVPEHFIGGHPALDLANTVYDRRAPLEDNDLFGSVSDISCWLRQAGLADDRQGNAVSGIAETALLEDVRDIREATFSLFDAIAAARQPPADALGMLFRRAANSLCADAPGLTKAKPELTFSQWRDAEAVTAFLAVLSVQAFFTLPRDRVRSCPRCGWVFVDHSRGGRRRWCSMRTCGNREKMARHRKQADLEVSNAER